jgi:hypothetical protein
LQFAIFLKKSDIEKIFGLESPKILNVFACRNKQVVEKRKINEKENALINLFEVLPFLIKHLKRSTKNPKKMQKKAKNEISE